MSSISLLFEQAQLAEASYADFWNQQTGSAITDPAQVRIRLIALGLSDAQATEFVSHWRVVYHQKNLSSGFSSTVFESIDEPGTYVYALRGTEGLLSWDLVGADLGDIVTDGLALDQIVDMYNDWKRISAGAGAVYTAAKLETLLTETAAYQLARIGGFVTGFNMTAEAYLPAQSPGSDRCNVLI